MRKIKITKLTCQDELPISKTEYKKKDGNFIVEIPEDEPIYEITCVCGHCGDEDGN